MVTEVSLAAAGPDGADQGRGHPADLRDVERRGPAVLPDDAAQVVPGDPALLDGDGPQAVETALAGGRVEHLGGIAGGEDVGVAGLEGVVGPDAAAGLEARLLRQLDARLRADRHRQEVAGQHGPGLGLDRRDPVLAPDHAGQLRATVDADAVLDETLLDERRLVRVEDARPVAVAAHQVVGLDPLRGKALGQLDRRDPAADDTAALRPTREAQDAAGVVEVVERHDAVELDAGDRRPHGSGPDGEQQAVVGHRPAVGEGDPVVRGLDPLRRSRRIAGCGPARTPSPGARRAASPGWLPSGGRPGRDGSRSGGPRHRRSGSHRRGRCGGSSRPPSGRPVRCRRSRSVGPSHPPPRVEPALNTADDSNRRVPRGQRATHSPQVRQ